MTNTAETEYAELIMLLRGAVLNAWELPTQEDLRQNDIRTQAATALSSLLAEKARLKEALKRAGDTLHSIAGDIEDGHSLADMRGKYVMAVLGARDRARAALHGDPQ